MLVTDRRRLTAAAGIRDADWQAVLSEQIKGAVAAGADFVQVREPDLDAPTLMAFLASVFAEVHGSAARVVVNSREELAREAGARGVHLPEATPWPGDIQFEHSTDNKWVMGRSVHSPRSAAESAGATYLLAGTVASSQSKPDGWPTLGWDGLARLVRSAGITPVLAIGGLQVSDVPAIVRSGAAGLAGIGCFIPRQGEDIASWVHDRVRAVQLAFDTLRAVPYTQGTGR
jgi:thiamine-phosphate diphosphorylase